MSFRSSHYTAACGIFLSLASGAFADDTAPMTWGLTGGLGIFGINNAGEPAFAGTGSAYNITGVVNNWAPMALSSTSLSAPAGGAGQFGLSMIAMAGSGTLSGSTTLSGQGSLYIPGLATPAGTINLQTDAAVPSASSAIAGTGVDQVVNAPANAGGAQNLFGVSQDIGGNTFSLAGGSTYNGATNGAAAYGAIASGAGGAFAAVGDLTGMTVSTDVGYEIFFAGGDLTYGVSGSPDEDVSLQAYMGPSYRFLNERFTTEVSVDIAEMSPVLGSFEYPLYKQTTRETLTAHYAGGVLGGGLSVPLSDTSVLSLVGEGGLYWMSTHASASESYSISGGSPALAGGDQTVNKLIGFSADSEGLAFSLKGHAVYTTPLSNNMQLHIGASAEYLSAVPKLVRATTGSSVVGDDMTVNGAGGGATLTTASMMNYGLKLSVTGQY